MTLHLQLIRKQLELESLVEYFYAISGVPQSKAVEVDNLHHMRVFIQSTSQGSRCLKKEEKLLYLEEVNNIVSPCIVIIIT